MDYASAQSSRDDRASRGDPAFRADPARQGDPALAGDPGNTAMTSVKIVIAGGFGVGKTTFVGSVSEITPLTTEAALTSAMSPS